MKPILLALLLSGCEYSDLQNEYRTYLLERTAVRVCHSKVVYHWRGTNYILDGKRYPDMPVTVPLDEFCK